MLKILKNKKILLDVDTGIDDALAIILLYQYLADSIIGITTCGGNVGIGMTTKNTLGVLSLLTSKIPIYIGGSKPLKNNTYINAFDYHGENGLCNINLPTNNLSANIGAVEFIIQSVKNYKEKLIIISLSPPTNIAKAIIKDKTIKKYINKYT